VCVCEKKGRVKVATPLPLVDIHGFAAAVISELLKQKRLQFVKRLNVEHRVRYDVVVAIAEFSGALARRRCCLPTSHQVALTQLRLALEPFCPANRNFS